MINSCVPIIILFCAFFHVGISVTTINIGVLLMTSSPKPFDQRRIGPAIELAFQKSEDYYGIRYNATYHNYTGDCPMQKTIGHFSELYYQQNIRAFVGPACSQSIVAVGKLAQYLNVPMVSGVGDLVIRAQHDMYETFTRTSYNVAKFSTSIMTIMKHFKWSNIAVIYDLDFVFFDLVGSNLVKEFKADSNWPRPADLHFRGSQLKNPPEILLEASKSARFIVLLCEAHLLRMFMYHAHQLGQTGGGYAFFTMELFPSSWWGFYKDYLKGDYMDESLKKAYQSLLLMSLFKPVSNEFTDFEAGVRQKALSVFDFDFGLEEVNYFLSAFYDGVLYLSESYNKTLAEGGDINDGRVVSQKLWNSTYKGISGTVAIDEFGDRIADFNVLDIVDPNNGTFQVVGSFYGSRLEFVPNNIPIHWPAGLPPNEPECGFTGEKCTEQPVVNALTVILAVVLAFLMLASGIVGLILYRRLVQETQSSKRNFLIPWKEVHVHQTMTAGSLTCSKLTIKTNGSSRSDIIWESRQLFTTVGSYHGNTVAIRKLRVPVLDITKDIEMELRTLYRIQHANLARFFGIVVEYKKNAVLMEYCPRGSLQDIIENDDINLDCTFRYSLINDIIKGMIYIHDSSLRYHGKLSSTNCVIDSRFMLKITDYGMPTISKIENSYQAKNGTQQQYSKYLWMAPEILRMHVDQYIKLTSGTWQKADVYSFAIILQEIALRSSPFDGCGCSMKQIIQKVRQGPAKGVLFRPCVPVTSCNPGLIDLMEKCWAENPFTRPNFKEIASIFRKIDKNNHGNIMDNLMKRMEQYANNLESLVNERTAAYLEEKKKAVSLLHRLLPPFVASQLEQGNTVMPEMFPCVTIYFSDIVGFTRIAASSTPMEVVALLNELYTKFDTVIDRMDVYKVETIGDAYMVVSGLPKKNNFHADEIAKMALEIIAEAEKFKIHHLPDEELQLRVGLHSGPVVAGVVGLKMPRYCLFGDTVNTASRMESNSAAQKINISRMTKFLLDKYDTYIFESRGELNIKGKGLMECFWLVGKLDEFY